MRTTVHLDEHLLAQMKKCAAESRRTLTSVPEEALRDAPGAARAKPVSLETVQGCAVRPGVDVHDSSSLLDVLVYAHREHTA